MRHDLEVELHDVRMPFGRESTKLPRIRTAASVLGPGRQASKGTDQPAGAAKRTGKDLRADDFLDMCASFEKDLVHRGLICPSQAQESNVVTRRQPRQQLSRCLAAVTRVEPRRERRADEKSAPPFDVTFSFLMRSGYRALTRKRRHGRSVWIQTGDVASHLGRAEAAKRLALSPPMSDTRMCVQARGGVERRREGCEGMLVLDVRGVLNGWLPRLTTPMKF